MATPPLIFDFLLILLLILIYYLFSRLSYLVPFSYLCFFLLAFLSAIHNCVFSLRAAAPVACSTLGQGHAAPDLQQREPSARTIDRG